MSMLRNRSLAAIIVAELVSLTGSSMTYVALPWFVLVTTGSTAKMGWVLAAELLPVGLLGIPAGSLIARLGAKRTMNVADAARCPAHGRHPGAALDGTPDLWCAAGVHVPARLLHGAVLLVLAPDPPGGPR
jgi:MFS family permease